MILLEDLKQNGLAYCDASNLISVGSTRATYGVGDYVVKQHLFPMAYEQSQQELLFYQQLPESLKMWFTAPYYVGKDYSIFERVEPLNREPWAGFRSLDDEGRDSIYRYLKGERQDLSTEEVATVFNQVVQMVKAKGLMIDDLLVDFNVGYLNGQFKFLDYGFSKDLSEDFLWLTTYGRIPYTDIRCCEECGETIYLVNYKDRDIFFGHCRCGKFHSDYPLQQLSEWASQEIPLEETEEFY